MFLKKLAFRSSKAIFVAGSVFLTSPSGGQPLAQPHSTVKELNAARLVGEYSDKKFQRAKEETMLRALHNYCAAVRDSVTALTDSERRLLDQQSHLKDSASKVMGFRARRDISSFGSSCTYSSGMALEARSESARCEAFIDLARTFHNTSSPGSELWWQAKKIGVPESLAIQPIFFHLVAENILFGAKLVCKPSREESAN